MPGYRGDQFVAAMPDHRLHAVERIVPMELQGHDMPAVLEGLVIAAVAGGQANRAGRYREGVAVPMKGRNLLRKTREERRCGRRGSERHGEPADLLLPVLRDLPAQHGTEQLPAQADAQHRNAAIDHAAAGTASRGPARDMHRADRRSWARPAPRANRGLRARAAVDRGPSGCESADVRARGPRRQYWRHLRTPRAASNGCACKRSPGEYDQSLLILRHRASRSNKGLAG